MLEMSDEEFRARLRPVVRMVVEHEVRKPKPKGPFLFFLFFCLDIRGDDPVQEIIKSLLSSLRKKREMSRRARAAAVPPPRRHCRNSNMRVEPDTSGNLGFETRSRREGLENRSELEKFMRIAEDLATKRSAESGVSRGVEPTERELLAENMVRFANRGRRILALKIAEELASRNLAFGRSHRRDAPCDPHEPEKFTPVLADAAPRPRRECEVSKGVQFAAGTNEDAIQRPPIQRQAIEKADVTYPEKVIEGCGDRVDPRIENSLPRSRLEPEISGSVRACFVTVRGGRGSSLFDDSG